MVDLDFLRNYCNSLPAVTEDIKWGHDLCFNIGGKMFAVTNMEPPISVSFKVPNDDFELLTQKSGFIPAPYLARHKWVLLEDIEYVNKDEMEAFLYRSYELVKAKLPKKLRAEIELK